jgi:hypothetical protein
MLTIWKFQMWKWSGFLKWFWRSERNVSTVRISIARLFGHMARNQNGHTSQILCTLKYAIFYWIIFYLAQYFKKFLCSGNQFSFHSKYSFYRPLDSAARRALTGPVQLCLWLRENIRISRKLNLPTFRMNFATPPSGKKRNPKFRR